MRADDVADDRVCILDCNSGSYTALVIDCDFPLDGSPYIIENTFGLNVASNILTLAPNLLSIKFVVVMMLIIKYPQFVFSVFAFNSRNWRTSGSKTRTKSNWLSTDNLLFKDAQVDRSCFLKFLYILWFFSRTVGQSFVQLVRNDKNQCISSISIIKFI